MIRDPKIKTKVVHSKSNLAWNIIGTTLGGKYKIARVPYIEVNDKEEFIKNKNEAFVHAEFISKCFNNSTIICMNL